MRHFYSSILTLLVFLSISYPLQAASINVSGTISSNTTWSGNPVYVVGNLVVNNGATLTIPAGTEVIFNGDYKIEVQGRILAIGTASSPITFNPSSTTSNWAGIRFIRTSTTNDTSKFVYCNISHSVADGSSSYDRMGGAFMMYQYSKVLIQNCSIKNCSSTYYGGAIACYYQSSPVISNNVIDSNSAKYYGGGLFIYYKSDPEITGNEISYNESNSYYAGGIDVYYKSDPLIKDNTITNNFAKYNGGGIRIYYNSKPKLINNLIANNSAFSQGGGVYIGYNSTAFLLGNTIAYNLANSNGGGVYVYNSTPTIVNTIVYGNSSPSSTYAQIYPTTLGNISYCNIEDGYTGSHNQDVDPKFNTAPLGAGSYYSAATADYSLLSSSPCIDSGSTQYNSWYAAFDLDHNVRIDGSSIDMGAYEYISSTTGCGSLASNTTWSGRVLVTCNLIIPNGITLTIEPGTEIRFTGKYSISVEGNLQAIGTKDSSICFKSFYSNIRWNGIRFNAMASTNNDSKLEYCTIKNTNSNGGGSAANGGAVYIYKTSKVKIKNCIITSNAASSYGGGICIDNSGSPEIIGNAIVNNEAYYGGGIAVINGATPIIYNNTIVNNGAYYGGGLYDVSKTATVKNCIFWSNKALTSANEIYPGSGVSIAYSDIEGGYTGTGNINSDPKFKQTTAGDGKDYDGSDINWALEEASPCIDAGTPSTTGMNLPSLDLYGKTRVYSSAVDMGATEDKSFITVKGTISADQVWDANKIKIDSNVYIAAKVTVTIPAGRIVEFQGPYKIEVDGALQALGKENDSIVFTSVNSSYWNGIELSRPNYLSDSIIFDHCIFTRAQHAATSYSLSGGAIAIYYARKVRISHSRFTNNAVTGGYQYYNKGGAIGIYGHSYGNYPIKIYNNLFYKNSAYYAGAVSIYYSDYIEFNNNIMIQDSATYGGALYVYNAENGVFNNNKIFNCGARYGGAVYNVGSDISTFKNNLIANNSATYYGGAFYIYSDAKPNIYNTTIVNNKASNYGGAFYLGNNSDPIFKNCIIHGNKATSGNQFYLSSAVDDPKFYYSLVEGDSSSFAGTGSGIQYNGVYLDNIDGSPEFTSPTTGAGNYYKAYNADFSIKNISPCINLGTPNANELELPNRDLSGSTRVFNGRVDMGAYENQDPIYAECTISSNTTWDADTIKVSCDVTVNNGKTLTIMPGTFVQFLGHYSITINGTILANGTADEQITFATTDTSGFYDSSIANGGWNGIVFNNTYTTNDSSKFKYCIIKFGKAFKGTGSSRYYGGAFYIYNYSKIHISNCLITNNIAGYRGGAFYIESGNPVITNNIITNNSTTSNYNYTRGGAFYLDDANPLLVNNTIANNKCVGNYSYGGGLYLYNSSAPSIKNNIIWGNESRFSTYGGGQIYINKNCAADFYNNDIEGGYNKIYGYKSTIANYTDNIETDPGFISPSKGAGSSFDGITAVWDLAPSSACVNTGLSNLVGLNLSDKDINGRIRVVADTLDIGAYEVQISSNFISQQPQSASVCQGTSASFSTAASINANYQWYKNSVPISNANSKQYVISISTLADSGDYFCVISNDYGSIITDTVSLSINVSPTVTSHPSSGSACIGSSVTFNVSATGTAPLSYQWTNLNGSLSGGTNSGYTINSVTANDASTYRCLVTNGCGTALSNGATLTTLESPSISSLVSTSSICEDGTQSYTVTATGNPTPTYQWYKDNNLLSSQTSSILSINNASSSDEGNYYCKASNSCGADSTNTSFLNVELKPVVTASPSNDTLCENQSVSLSVTATGEAPLSYQWYHDNSLISGATNNTYTISSASTSDAGDYYCKVSNSCGSDNSSTAKILINTSPSITTQPSNTTECEGNPASFSLASSGTPSPTYQWYNSSGAISGATSSTVSLSNIGTSDAGNYYCKVTNGCGTVQSNSASLSVNTSPTVSSLSSDPTVCEGNSATFSVSASGTSPLSYSWYNTSGAITGATSSTYTLNSVDSADAGNYYCKVSNTCGNTQTNNIKLTVNQSPTIGTQPSSTTVCENGSPSFSVTASGTAPLTYQWYSGSGKVSSATSSTYSITSASTSNAGNYYVVVSNTCGTKQSASATLTINTAPDITAQTSAQTLCEGKSALFSVTATGTSPLSYQWYGPSGSITGASNSSYSISSISSSDAGSYYCKVSNTCGNVSGNNISLTVNKSPSITTQPSDITVCEGTSTSFSLTASGTGTLSYQWYNGSGVMSGKTSYSLPFGSVSSSDAGNYYCVVSNTCGNIQSTTRSLSVNTKPSITSQTSNTSKCEGSSITLGITASGTSPISYQWSQDNSNITGASGSSYSISSLDTNDAGSYICVASNTCGNASSNAITLTVNSAPTLTSQSSGTTVCEGSSPTFSVTATGTSPLSYQWYNNSGSISSATNNSYSLTSAKTSDAGNYYCVITNTCGSVQSTSKLLTVRTNPVASYITPSSTECQGQSITFYSNVSGSAPISYQWYFKSKALSSDTNSTLTLSNIDANDAGSYYYIAKNDCSSDQSTSSTLTVNKPPSISSQSGNVSTCSGSSSTFSVTASGSSPLSYQWYNDKGKISSATNNQYSLTADTSKAGNYYCVVTNGCGNSTSTTKVLNVLSKPAISAQNSSQTKCAGESATLYIQASGSTPITYQWYQGTKAISGAVNAIYSIPSLNTSDAGSYYCEAKNTCGSINATTTTLTINEAPVVTNSTQNTTLCEGATMTFKSSASGTKPISFQWYNSAGIISGAKGPKYEITTIDTSHADNYYVIATNSCGDDQGKAISLSVDTKPSITPINDSLTLCESENLVLTTLTSGTNPQNYQWYLNGKSIKLANSSFYLAGSITTNDAGKYVMEATNNCGTSASDTMYVWVNSPVAFTVESGDSSKCEGQNTQILARANGTSPISYQWYNSQGALTGETSDELNFSNLLTSNSDKYYCEANNVCGTKTSAIKKLTIHANPVVNIGNDTTICYGQTVKLSAGSNYFCNWNTGSTNSEIYVLDSGTYYVNVEDVNGCTATSNSVNIRVKYPFNGEEICMVTVDPNTGKNLIAWERTKGKGIAYYNVYKESTQAGNFVKIGSVPFTDKYAEFVDLKSVPKQHSDRYAITAVDSCGNESDLSPIHKTLHLTANKGVGGVVNLIWDHYEGFNHKTYRIFRGTHPDSMQIIDSIQSNLFSYTDLNPPKGMVYYQVSAVNPHICRTDIFRSTSTSGPFSQSLSNLKDYNTISNDYLTVTPGMQFIDTAYGSTVTFNVYTNLSNWNISTTANWLAVENDFTNKTITVTAISGNPQDYEEGAFITVSANGLDDVKLKVVPTGASALNEIAVKPVLVYPNPFKYECRIILPENENLIREVRLMDMNGKTVKVFHNLQGNAFDLYREDLQKGIYLMQIFADKIYQSRVIIY